MPCYHPIPAWQLLNVKTASGRSSISFKNPHAEPSAHRVGIKVPCGQCIGCRLERSRQWAIRCVHEASLHEENCFITLTYSPENLPPGVSLVKSHFQKFMKRLRKAIFPTKVRFYQCGEYGEQNSRPHYHACLFGYDFPDKVLYTIRNGCRLYQSEMLKKIWGLGFVTVGNVTFESAAYVARYITKKITGEASADHYKGRVPEYTTMSRASGIGKNWFESFMTDVYPCDNIVIRGKIMTPPRYYDKKLEELNLAMYEKIKLDRKAKALENAADNTKARLLVKETCKMAQFKQLKRGYENET